MALMRRLIVGLLGGAMLGAPILGIGGRMVMRLLALSIDREPVFSLGGSIEVVAYGGIVGAVTGALLALVAPHSRLNRWAEGMAVGVLAYLGTIATLPPHIAETARPFADRMALVHILFGCVFILFGLALARIAPKR